jgi:hypothetical protein
MCPIVPADVLRNLRGIQLLAATAMPTVGPGRSVALRWPYRLVYTVQALTWTLKTVTPPISSMWLCRAGPGRVCRLFSTATTSELCFPPTCGHRLVTGAGHQAPPSASSLHHHLF